MNLKDVLPQDSYTLFDMDDATCKEVENRLYPGAYSGVGFLKGDDSFKAVVIGDLKTLKRLGVSCDKIYHTILAHLEENDQSKEEKRRIEITYGVSTNGYQRCPFERDTLCHKGRKIFTITNTETNESIEMSDLGVELIRHAFFQNSKYRIDPKKLCRVLNIGPGEYQTRQEARLDFRACEVYFPENEAILKTKAKKSFELSPSATAYFGLTFEDVENPSEVSETETFCHIVIRDDRHSPYKRGLLIDGKVLKQDLIFEGHFVFLETEKTVAVLK